MRVECEIEVGEIENEGGRMVPGVSVCCGRCGHTVESFGTTERSVKRCFAIMKEECPNSESNYYFAADQEQPKKAAPASSKFKSKTTTPAAQPVPDLIRQNQFCVMKAATTGLSVAKDELVQLGLIQIDFGTPKWRMYMNFEPSVRVSDGAASCHGLTNERLAGSAKISDVARNIFDVIGNRVILGYNCGEFDIPILDRQIGAAQFEGEVGLDGFPVVDVLYLERKYAAELARSRGTNGAVGHTLADAAKRWGVPLMPNYDSLNDAKVIWAVFVALCNFGELGQMSLGQVLELIDAEKTLTGMGLRTSRRRGAQQ